VMSGSKYNKLATKTHQLIIQWLFVLTVMIFSHCRQLQTPTNLLLLSLAVSDFLVGLLVMPFQIFLIEPCWFLGDLVCVLFYLIPFITVCASIVNMILISVDRYVAICNPLRYATQISQRRVQIFVLLCWIYTVFYSILILYDNLKQPGRYNSCYGECVINYNGAVDMMLFFIIPITAIVILYMRVFVVAVPQARAMRSHIAAVTLQRSVTVTAMKSEMKAARTLGILVAFLNFFYEKPIPQWLPLQNMSLLGLGLRLILVTGLKYQTNYKTPKMICYQNV
uniref:G-protein coupled receptors family 1 profile domain-containing protein n=1 Tax=Monopterus albus TaxID=43700 RepID=A0A3Q3ID70_MONAL